MMDELSGSIYSTVAPVVYLSQLLGVMPLTYKNTYSYNQKPPFRVSILYLLYAIFSIVVTVLHISAAPLYIIKTSYPYHYGAVALFSGAADEDEIIDVDNKQTVAMKIISPIISSTMSLSARLTGVVYLTSRVPSFLQQMQVVDSLLSALPTFGDVATIYKDDFRSSLKVLAYVAAMSLPIHVDYLCTVYFSPDVELWSLVWCFTLVWSNLSACACEAQFMTFALLLSKRYKAINSYLVLHTATKAKSTRSRLLCRWKRRLANRRIVAERRQPSFLLGLELSRRCHTKLCDLIGYLSRTYQVQFATTLSGCFLKTLFFIYFAIFGLVISTGSGRFEQRTNVNEFEEIVKTIMWILFYFLRFLNIVFTANRAVKEANLTKCLLVDINSRYMDEEVKEELALFADHTASRRVEFSACSLFSINTRLITSAIATGTTYLVILVQFHTPSSSMKRDQRT